ncbi:PHP domain-containing protein [Candidatus Omnitrophota bacterium]
MKYADLHVHTHFSDGTFAPEEVVATACEKGLSCIAICDHDCVDGIEPAIESARGTSLEVVPGVELTVIEDGKEIHLLGYFISWKEDWFGELMKRIQRERLARVDKMLAKLKDFNIDIKKDDVMRMASGKGSVGRLHVAQAMLESKAVPTIQAAFSRYIGDCKPCYVHDIGFEAREAIDIINNANGVPVLAHPAMIGDDVLVRDFIKYGIRGIEVFYANQPRKVTNRYKVLAEEHNLIATGGSDCHGLGKGRVLMGGVKVPYSVVENLRKEASKR